MTLEDKMQTYADSVGCKTHQMMPINLVFMAGAAAMAELFAAGQVLRIESAPRRYKVTWIDNDKIPKTSDEIVQAYNADEAAECVYKRNRHKGMIGAVIAVEAAEITA